MDVPVSFSLRSPRTLDEALDILRIYGDEAKVLAGGQSLIPLIKLRFASPEMLIDINGIAELDYHRADPDGTLHIGALCRHSDLERSELIKSRQPTMAACAPLISDPLVRNRGTLVGSLCHADPQGDWASVMLALAVTSSPLGPRAGAPFPYPSSSWGRSRTRCVRGRSRSRPECRRRRGPFRGPTSKLERRVGDFATVGVAVALESSGHNVTRAGIALTGVGRQTSRPRPPSRRSSARCSTPARSSRRPGSRRRQPDPSQTIAAAQSTSAMSCTRSSRAHWAAVRPGQPEGGGSFGS